MSDNKKITPEQANTIECIIKGIQFIDAREKPCSVVFLSDKTVLFNMQYSLYQMCYTVLENGSIANFKTTQVF